MNLNDDSIYFSFCVLFFTLNAYLRMYSYKYYYLISIRSSIRAYLEIVKCNNKCEIIHGFSGIYFYRNDSDGIIYLHSYISIYGIMRYMYLKCDKDKIYLKYSEKGNSICCIILYHTM